MLFYGTIIKSTIYCGIEIHSALPSDIAILDALTNCNVLYITLVYGSVMFIALPKTILVGT